MRGSVDRFRTSARKVAVSDAVAPIFTSSGLTGTVLKVTVAPFSTMVSSSLGLVVTVTEPVAGVPPTAVMVVPGITATMFSMVVSAIGTAAVTSRPMICSLMVVRPNWSTLTL
ncbi:hypothetical protein D9M69_713430 [compost metagenome]